MQRKWSARAGLVFVTVGGLAMGFAFGGSFLTVLHRQVLEAFYGNQPGTNMAIALGGCGCVLAGQYFLRVAGGDPDRKTGRNS